MNLTIEQRAKSDRRTALGLSFVYAGLCLAVLSVVWLALLPHVFLRLPKLAVSLLDYFLPVFGLLLVGAVVCSFVGRAICLLMSWREVGAIFYLMIIFGLFADVITIVVSTMMALHAFNPDLPHLGFLESYALTMAIAGHAFFLMLLIRLSAVLRRTGLIIMSALALVSWACLTGLLVYINKLPLLLVAALVASLGEFGLWSLAITCTVALVSYGNTLSYLRRALKERAAASIFIDDEELQSKSDSESAAKSESAAESEPA